MIVDHENRFCIAVPMGIGAGPWLKRIERAGAKRTTLEVVDGYHNMSVPEGCEDYDRYFLKAKTQRRMMNLWQGRQGRPWESPHDDFESWLEWYDSETDYWLERCVKVRDDFSYRGKKPKRINTLLPESSDAFPKDETWQWATGQGLQLGMFLDLGTDAASALDGLLDINVESSWKHFFMHEEYFDDGDSRSTFTRRLLLSCDPDVQLFLGLDPWPVRRCFTSDMLFWGQKLPADPYSL